MAEGWKSNRARVVQAFVRKNLLSLDHKMIGKQYYAPALVAVFIGMVLSWLMRIHVAWPSVPIPGLRFLSGAGAPAGVMTPGYYLSLMTMHGTLMVFFVLSTVPQSGFGTFFLPLQLGARRRTIRWHELEAPRTPRSRSLHKRQSPASRRAL